MTVMTVDSWKEALVSTYRKLVSEELEVIHGQPPESLRKHNKAVMEQTLLRRVVLVRSRSGAGGDEAAVEAHRAAVPRQAVGRRRRQKRRGRLQQDACQRCLDMLNGDMARNLVSISNLVAALWSQEFLRRESKSWMIL